MRAPPMLRPSARVHELLVCSARSRAPAGYALTCIRASGATDGSSPRDVDSGRWAEIRQGGAAGSSKREAWNGSARSWYGSAAPFLSPRRPRPWLAASPKQFDRPHGAARPPSRQRSPIESCDRRRAGPSVCRIWPSPLGRHCMRQQTRRSRCPFARSPSHHGIALLRPLLPRGLPGPRATNGAQRPSRPVTDFSGGGWRFICASSSSVARSSF